MKAYNQQTIIVLIGCMALLWFMWWSLANKVQSGKPFLLENKWYQATEVESQTGKP